MLTAEKIQTLMEEEPCGCVVAKTSDRSMYSVMWNDSDMSTKDLHLALLAGVAMNGLAMNHFTMEEAISVLETCTMTDEELQ